MRIPFTTDALGAATVNGSRSILGRLYAIQADIDATVNGAIDLTISTQGAAGSKTVHTLANLAGDGLFYPRDVVHDAAGTALTGTAGGDRALPLLDGTPRVVVAQGGNALAGAVVLYFEEG
jgi:hypothetical protein